LTDGDNVSEVFRADGLLWAHGWGATAVNSERTGHSGATHIEVEINYSMAIPQIMNKLFAGAIETVTMYKTAHINAEGKLAILQAIMLNSVVIVGVQPFGMNGRVIVQFAYSKVTLAMAVIGAEGTGGATQSSGFVVSTIDFTQPSATAK
jgi:hypothetical protein